MRVLRFFRIVEEVFLDSDWPLKTCLFELKFDFLSAFSWAIVSDDGCSSDGRTSMSSVFISIYKRRINSNFINICSFVRKFILEVVRSNMFHFSDWQNWSSDASPTFVYWSEFFVDYPLAFVLSRQMISQMFYRWDKIHQNMARDIHRINNLDNNTKSDSRIACTCFQREKINHPATKKRFTLKAWVACLYSFLLLSTV